MRTILETHSGSQRSLKTLISMSPPATARSAGLTSPSHLTHLANLRISMSRTAYPRDDLTFSDRSQFRSNTTSLSPALSPRSPLPASASLSLSRRLPLDEDYQSILTRLDQVIHGASAIRSVLLTEEKPLSFSVVAGEWQYVKVKTEGMKTPMKVTIHRHKGKVITYVSRSALEPTETSYDEMHHRDIIELSEFGGKFRGKVVTLGIHCQHTGKFTLSLHFGAMKQEHRLLAKSDTLTSLSEFRRDEAKRQALFDQVEALLSLREAERQSRLGSRNYIRMNILALAEKPDFSEKREMEQQRRTHAIKRKKEVLEQKKSKAELYLRKNELRMEEEARLRAEQEERQRHITMQSEWLRLIILAKSAEELRSAFLRKKEKQLDMMRQMRAAMTLQRCLRKVVFHTSPTQRGLEHSLHHLRFFCGIIGPELAQTERQGLFQAIRSSFHANRLPILTGKYYAKSKRYAVKLIQHMWRRYRYVKEARMVTLSRLWDSALKELVKESSKAAHKKTKKPVQMMESKYMAVNRIPVLEAHLKECKEIFYKRIAAYIKTGKGYRRGIKAMLFLSKRRDSVYMTAAPTFHYMMTVDDMKEMIKRAMHGYARNSAAQVGNA